MSFNIAVKPDKQWLLWLKDGVQAAPPGGILAAMLLVTIVTTAYFAGPLEAGARGLWTPFIGLGGAAFSLLLCAVFAVQAQARNKAHARALQIAEQAQRDLLQWEQTARQAAEEANRAKDEFLAVVSHELRTPLNALAGWVHMLRSGKLDPAATARAMLMVERNTQAQIRLTEDLLDFASLHAHQLGLHLETLVVSDLVAAAWPNAQMEARAKGVTLNARTDQQAGVMAADPSRLQQILSNLLTNAIKFTPPGGAVTLATARDGNFIAFTIRDTGKGIAPEFLPHVFERFRQEDAATARNFGGLGLGLAIVSQLVALHGGSVTAASDGLGQGACFVVRLPVSASDTAIGEPFVRGFNQDLYGNRR